MSVINSNPQNRVKDCYVPIPAIDLTLRCNGEEKVELIDSLGNRIPAGITPPTVSPSVTAAGAAVFTAGQFWAYRYVYVGKTNFPLVQNAVTGGGSPAPRSNPSPGSLIQSGTTSTLTRNLSITPSQEWWVSHIWVYRTPYFTSATETDTASQAGVMFWIGEVANNPNVATIPFADGNTNAGEEQIENDNFPAPQFMRAVYAEPYAYGFCNDIYDVEVTVTSSGFATIANPTANKWFSGRDGQLVHLDGITTGGADNHGLFYFKWVSNSTAQLYYDIALTLPATLGLVGTTMMHIQGPSTQLYFSKPNNPLSWGSTDLLGDVQVPSPNIIPVGGRRGTAISVLSNLSLLKVDTEGPNLSYTFNLKNAGTINFPASKRILTDTYCVSLHESQFTATLARGENVTWALDGRSFSIIECDGTSQRPISSPVYKTLRNIATDDSYKFYFHGVYAPNMEMNCMFVKTVEDESGPGRLIYQHAPTGYWGMVDFWGITSSAVLLHPITKESIVFVGSDTGMLGELFAKDYYWQWLKPTSSSTGLTQTGVDQAKATESTPNTLKRSPFGSRPSFFAGGVPIEGLIGNYVTLITYKAFGTVTDDDYQTYQVARILDVPDADTITIDPDSCFSVNLTTGQLQSDVWEPYFDNNHIGIYYIGLIESVVARSFNMGLPSQDKKIEQILANWSFSQDNTDHPERRESTYEIYPGCMYVNPLLSKPVRELSRNDYKLPNDYVSSLPSFPQPKTLSIDKINTELSRNFCLVLRDRHYTATRLHNYEIKTTVVDGDNN